MLENRTRRSGVRSFMQGNGASIQDFNSVGHGFAFSRRDTPELCVIFHPPRNQRAQGRPGACCTRGLACDLRKQNCTRAYRAAENTPAFPAQWLYGLLRALPGERLFCLRRLRELPIASLTPAPRRPNHTTSPYASGAYVYRALSVHRISPHVRDDREAPLICRETGGVMRLIWVRTKAEYF